MVRQVRVVDKEARARLNKLETGSSACRLEGAAWLWLMPFDPG